MVRCKNGSLYTGYTTDLARRLAQHQNGTGAKYTRAFGPVRLAYAEQLPDKGAALRREAALKKLPKAQKETLCAAFAAQKPPLPPGSQPSRLCAARCLHK